MEFIYSGAPYIKAQQESWFYIGLRNIYRDFYGKSIQTQTVPPEGFLKYADPKRLLEMRDSGIDIPYDETVKIQRKFREGPIAVKITVDEYKLTWDFGPRRDKPYTLLRSNVSGLYYNKSELRASGTYMLPGGREGDSPDEVYVRVFYTADDGGEVITPEFALRIPSSQEIEYASCQ